MATHSFIGTVDDQGRFSGRTVTYDGNPAGVGASLGAVLCSAWAGRSPSRVLAELAAYRCWWSIGLDLDGPTRVGHPDERPDVQEVPLVTGRLGRSIPTRQLQWGYLFRGEAELVVVKCGQWWQTPAYPVQQWAVVPVASIELVDWVRVERTGELSRRDRRDPGRSTHGAGGAGGFGAF